MSTRPFPARLPSPSVSDGNNATPGSRTTFKLGSDLTLASRFNLPAASRLQTPELGRIDLGGDAGSFTLDLLANSSVWTPTTSIVGSVTTAVWDLAGNGGTIIANGYDFTATGVTRNALSCRRSARSAARHDSRIDDLETMSARPPPSRALPRWSGTTGEFSSEPGNPVRQTLLVSWRS